MRLDARLAGQWAPTELGVRPVAGGGPLPAYIRRPHDEVLRRILAPPVAGSRLVVLRGEPGTGTSRAAWEAVADLLADWPLEYPRTAAALAERLQAGIPAGTVLWLGELGRYADADGGADALDRLDDLLEEDGYLIVATIWPWQWDDYSDAVGAGRGAGDPAWLAGRMLTRLDELSFYDPSSISPDHGGGVVDVPARFTAAELAEAAGSGDPVLAAAASAPDGQVTQYLAGIPELLRRFGDSGGDPQGRAVLTAAMDATRFGLAGPLPATLLERAAIGYLAEGSLDAGPEGAPTDVGPAGSLGDALAWACAVLDGAVGPVRALSPVPAAERHGYRLAGALDQLGRRARQDQAGPGALWDALIAHAAGAGLQAAAVRGDGGDAGAAAAPGTRGHAGVLDTIRLGQAARDRGLYRYAAALWTAAANRGSADAAARLVGLLGEISPADAARAAGWAAGRVRLDDAWDVARLLDVMRAAGSGNAIQALVARDPAGQASIRWRWDALRLLIALGAAQAPGAAEALGARLVESARVDDVPYVAGLLRALGTARADGAVRALLARDPAQHADPEDPPETGLLVTAMHAAGPEASDATRALADWAAEHCDLEGGQAVVGLLRAMRGAGQADAYRRLLDRDLLGQARLTDPWEAAALLAELRAAGADGAVRQLLDRDPGRLCEIGYADSVAWLLAELREAGDGEAIRRLLARDPARHVELWDMQAIAWLVAELRLAGDTEAIRTLATRVADLDINSLDYLADWLEQFEPAEEAIPILLPSDRIARAALGSPAAIAWLLAQCLAAGVGDAVRALLDRDPSGQANVADLRDVASLLAALRAAGDHDAARALAARAAGDAPQDSLADPGGTAALLAELHTVGDHDAARVLLDRDPARQARLDRPRDVTRLLAALRAAGEGEAAGILARRAARAGMFGVFLAHLADEAGAGAAEAGGAEVGGAEAGRAEAGRAETGRAETGRAETGRAEAGRGEAGATDTGGTDTGGVGYRYGCEPDLTAAAPWRWVPPSPPAGL